MKKKCTKCLKEKNETDFSLTEGSWTHDASVLVRHLHEGVLQSVSFGESQEVIPESSLRTPAAGPLHYPAAATAP